MLTADQVGPGQLAPEQGLPFLPQGREGRPIYQGDIGTDVVSHIPAPHGVTPRISAVTTISDGSMNRKSGCRFLRKFLIPATRLVASEQPTQPPRSLKISAP